MRLWTTLIKSDCAFQHKTIQTISRKSKIMLAVLFRIKCLKKCSRSQIMLKKSASTIGKSLTGPTLMVLKGLGRMSWLYYDTCKLLDVLIFSKQDDKLLKKSELLSAVLLKRYSSKGVWVTLEDINMLFSLSLLKIQSFRWYSERWLHMSRSRHNLWYSSTNEINLKLKWQLEWNEHFKRSPK